MIVLLDTGVLGLITNPTGSPIAEECTAWLERLVRTGSKVAVPEIADYELRRELLRANRARALQRLDDLKEGVLYLPITSEVMLLAAAYWAKARNMGRPTADEKALDGDMILTAQAQLIQSPTEDVIIATDNIGHLSLFARAQPWRDIT